MADNSNIDEILKSIDALLKEGAADQRNDDVPASIVEPESVVGEAESVQMDENEPHALSILPDDANDGQNENEQNKRQQTATEQKNDDAPDESVAVAPLTGEKNQQKHQGKKRVVLSAAMQVTDTADEKKEPDIDAELIAHITKDVCAQLQRHLPKIVAPLVEKRLRHHLAKRDDGNKQ